MAGKPASLAERLRAHREEMALSMELGCTPREARIELNRRVAWGRHQDLIARTQAKQSASAQTVESERPTPWWQRD